MEAQFREMMRASMARGVADAQLRVWTPQGAQVLFVRQVSPTVEDLTDRRVAVNPLTGGYPTGAWADESRDYHVGDPGRGQGDRPGAARRARPAGDRRRRADPGPGQGHLVEQLRADRQDRPAGRPLHRADRAGLDDPGGARRQGAGDEATATTKLGRAVQLAAETGNDEATSKLRKVVDVQDEKEGTVRLKAAVAKADEMALDTASTKTTRIKKWAP